MIRGIVFDCFGVLVNDGLTTIVDELEQTRPEVAQQIRDIVQRATAGGTDAQTAREQVATLLGLTLDGYNDRIKQSEHKNQELLEYIRTLRPAYKVGVLSNILSGGLTVRFPEGEAEKYFDVMVASGEIGAAKPEARAYEITAKRLVVRLDECVMIDDREEYCEGARAVGMRAVLYRSFAQMRHELEAILG